MDDATISHLRIGLDTVECALSAIPNDEGDAKHQLLPFPSDITLRTDGNPSGGAVVRMADYTLDAVLNDRDKENSCIVVLEKIQDPGNLGTIIRTGEGAGITGVVMSQDTVDLYNPKVIRSTMGSIFRVPCVIVDDLGAAVNEMKASGITTYAAHLDGEDISSVELANDRAFLIGNEANGLSDEVANLADKKIKIPMEGEVESLNAAVATAILIYR